jgi:hypothetical protein
MTDKTQEQNQALMKEAIWKSGYLMEQRVTNVLNSAGYKKPVTNPVYFDPDTGKSHEYDVYAFKDIPVYETGLHGIFPTLICECKNNHLPYVFFVQEKELFQPFEDEVRVSGMPSKIWQHNKFISVQEFTGVESFHHYCKPEVPVASQYCTFKEAGKSSWIALHIEEQRGTPEQRGTFPSLIKALEFEIAEDFKLWRMDDKLKKEFIDLSFYYPVLIFQGDIYAAHIEHELNLKKCEHVQLNVEFLSSYEHDIISYHIDVICEEYLPSYLKIIDLEMEIIKRVLQQHKQKVQLSIDKIVERCKALEKKPKSYREYLEFDYNR